MRALQQGQTKCDLKFLMVSISVLIRFISIVKMDVDTIYWKSWGPVCSMQHVRQQHQDRIDTRNPGPESGIGVRMMVTAPEGCGHDSAHEPWSLLKYIDIHPQFLTAGRASTSSSRLKCWTESSTLNLESGSHNLGGRKHVVPFRSINKSSNYFSPPSRFGSFLF